MSPAARRLLPAGVLVVLALLLAVVIPPLVTPGATGDDPVSTTGSSPTDNGGGPVPSSATRTPTDGRQHADEDTAYLLRVVCGGEQVIETAVHRSEAAAGAVWSPRPGSAEWWSAGGWPPPGTPSSYAAVVGAHSRYDGAADAFARLDEVRAGCDVSVASRDADLRFEVVEAPEAIDKDGFTTAAEYDRYWEPDEEGTWLTLVTCDPAAQLGSDGHLRDNLAVRARLVG